MDFTDTNDEAAFRETAREWIEANAPVHLAEPLTQSGFGSTKTGDLDPIAEAKRWQKTKADAGWACIQWPEAYGGRGASPIEQVIWNQEEGIYSKLTGTFIIGQGMCAPTLMAYASEDQKRHYLPKLASGEEIWCQLFSEPQGGSDLAGLRTRAEKDGDQWVINGQKIWTSTAHHADWIFCLVRTDNSGKKQEGITFILVDMKSEGIKVNPIIGIDNEHNLNEVEFNNVRVPAKNVLGEVGKGWTVAKALLAHERTGIAGVADIKRNVRLLQEAAAAEVNGGERLLDDAGFQQRLADIEVELMALEFTELRTLAAMAAGGFPGPESSLLKIKGTELQQATQELRMEIAAYYQGVLSTDMDPEVLGHEFGSDARRAFMYGRAATIYGGSNEVQKNIISKYVLGLE